MAEQQFTEEELAKEKWRDVGGYVGVYSVSDLGRVRRDLPASGTRTGLLKLRALHDGYIRARLSRENVIKDKKVHVLVAAAFIGPKPPGHEVNHKDAVKSNCRLSNLEYKTKEGNTRHAMDMGLIPKGSKHSNAKLTENQVREIRRLYAGGKHGYRPLGITFGVDYTTIASIVKRRGWTHI